MSYNYYFLGGVNNSYIFETKYDLVYEIKFKTSPYIFPDLETELKNDIFEFVIDLSINPNQTKTPLDNAIGETVAEIFNDFFIKNDQSITVYICETNDKKEDLRMKKFDSWFRKFQDNSYLKLDEVLIDNKNNRFPISIIFKNSNPNRATILEAFIKITKIQSDNK